MFEGSNCWLSPISLSSPDHDCYFDYDLPEKHTCCFDSPKRFIDAIIGYQRFTDETSEKHFAISISVLAVIVAIVTIVAIVLSCLFDFKVRTDR